MVDDLESRVKQRQKMIVAINRLPLEERGEALAIMIANAREARLKAVAAAREALAHDPELLTAFDEVVAAQEKVLADLAAEADEKRQLADRLEAENRVLEQELTGKIPPQRQPN